MEIHTTTLDFDLSSDMEIERVSRCINLAKPPLIKIKVSPRQTGFLSKIIITTARRALAYNFCCSVYVPPSELLLPSANIYFRFSVEPIEHSVNRYTYTSYLQCKTHNLCTPNLRSCSLSNRAK